MNPPLHDLQNGHLTCCQVCGGDRLQAVIDLGHQAPCDSLLWPEQLHEAESTYPLRLVRCDRCSLAQIDFVVPPEVLFYPRYPYRSGITKTLAGNLRGTARAVNDRFPLDPDALVIDLGSNDGTLLSGFRDLGARVLGVEPTDIAAIANQSGIETLQRFFGEDVGRELARERGLARVVTAANMFAHVARLGDLIRGVEHLLAPGGVFVTESHYLLDLLETVQYDSIYHEHLKYYSLRALVQLFDSYDFTVVDVERIPNYGGSIRVYAARGRGLPVSPSVGKLLDEEQRYGLYQNEVFARFAGRVRTAKQALLRLAVETHGNGRPLAGVGCPGRSSTLLGYTGLDFDLMPYIAEQATSLKLGLFLPGKHIPIVNEEVLFREQPDYALMLSWHYWQPIAAKLREKGLRSKLVLPLPELRVLEG